MKLETVQILDVPRPVLFRAFRDELPQMVPQLPNIAEVRLLERRTLEGGTVQVRCRWRAAYELPRIARATIAPERLSWTDCAVWDETSWSCDWRLESCRLTDRVACQARSRYIELGPERTELALQGDLSIDEGRLPGIPGPLAGPIARALERFVVAVLTPNLGALSQGLVTYLQRAGGPDPAQGRER